MPEIFEHLAGALAPIVTIAVTLGVGGTLVGVAAFGRRAYKRYRAFKLDAEVARAHDMAEQWLAENLSKIATAHVEVNKDARNKREIAARKARKRSKASRKANR